MTIKGWISRCKQDRKKAFCKLCDCAIVLSTMGESAPKSNMRSAKHKNNAAMSMRGKQLETTDQTFQHCYMRMRMVTCVTLRQQVAFTFKSQIVHRNLESEPVTTTTHGQFLTTLTIFDRKEISKQNKKKWSTDSL